MYIYIYIYAIENPPKNIHKHPPDRVSRVMNSVSIVVFVFSWEFFPLVSWLGLVHVAVGSDQAMDHLQRCKMTAMAPVHRKKMPSMDHK